MTEFTSQTVYESKPGLIGTLCPFMEKISSVDLKT